MLFWFFVVIILGLFKCYFEVIFLFILGLFYVYFSVILGLFSFFGVFSFCSEFFLYIFFWGNL